MSAAGIAFVPGVLKHGLVLVHRRRRVGMAGRCQRPVTGLNFLGARSGGRFPIAIISITTLRLPIVVVAAMAHSAAAPTEGKERKRSNAEHEQKPVTAKPFHSGVPSISRGTCLPLASCAPARPSAIIANIVHLDSRAPLVAPLSIILTEDLWSVIDRGQLGSVV